MIRDLDGHARRLGFRNNADLELYADALGAVLARRLRPRLIDPNLALVEWRTKARRLSGAGAK